MAEQPDTTPNNEWMYQEKAWWWRCERCWFTAPALNYQIAEETWRNHVEHWCSLAKKD